MGIEVCPNLSLGDCRTLLLVLAGEQLGQTLHLGYLRMPAVTAQQQTGTIVIMRFLLKTASIPLYRGGIFVWRRVRTAIRCAEPRLRLACISYSYPSHRQSAGAACSW